MHGSVLLRLFNCLYLARELYPKLTLGVMYKETRLGAQECFCCMLDIIKNKAVTKFMKK